MNNNYKTPKTPPKTNFNSEIKKILEDHLETTQRQAELGPSTYTESHRKYYQRYKALILARRRKYAKQYKHLWYQKNKTRILRELAEKRAKKQLELDFDGSGKVSNL